MDDIAVTLKLPTKSVTQKRTLTQRSDSSGSESSSPLDKRLKNSTHAEHEGEDDYSGKRRIVAERWRTCY